METDLTLARGRLGIRPVQDQPVLHRKGPRAVPRPDAHRIIGARQLGHHRRVPCAVARVAHRMVASQRGPDSLRRRRGDLVALLARPQRTLVSLRPRRTWNGRSDAGSDRRGHHGNLLGLSHETPFKSEEPDNSPMRLTRTWCESTRRTAPLMIDTDPQGPRLLKEGNLALPRRQLVKA